jgi:hypothetical protein
VASFDVDVDFVNEHQEIGSVSSNCLTTRLPDCPTIEWMIRVLLNREDADDAAPLTVVFEAYSPRDLRKDRVVLAEARVQAGPEATAALADDDRAACHDVAIVRLDA